MAINLCLLFINLSIFKLVFINISRSFSKYLRVCWGLDCMVVGFTTTYARVPITTKFVSLNPAHGEVYSIQHYGIKFVSDLRQVSGYLWFLRFPPPIKLTTTI